MRSLGRSSMNFETTDLTTSMRLTRWLSIGKSSACIEPETSSPSTMSMPLAVTSVRLWVALRAGESDDHERRRRGSAAATPSADPAAAAAGHVARETDVGIFDGGDGTAPPAPQHHQRQQRQQPKPLRLKEANHASPRSCGGVISGWALPTHEAARTLVQRFHVRPASSDMPANLTRSH